jgi:hypothetical protein
MTEEERLSQQFSAAINLIGIQSQAAWTIFTVFLAGHAILAQAMFSAKAIVLVGDRHFSEYVVASFGLITSFVWFAFQSDCLDRVKRLGDQITSLEQSWDNPSVGLSISAFVRQGKLVSALMSILPLLAGAAWLIGLYFIHVPLG